MSDQDLITLLWLVLNLLVVVDILLVVTVLYLLDQATRNYRSRLAEERHGCPFHEHFKENQ